MCIFAPSRALCSNEKWLDDAGLCGTCSQCPDGKGQCSLKHCSAKRCVLPELGCSDCILGYVCISLCLMCR